MHRTHTSTNQCMKKNCNTYQSIADLIDRLVHVGRLLGASDDGALETCDNFGLVRLLNLFKKRAKVTDVETPRKRIYKRNGGTLAKQHGFRRVGNESAKDCMSSLQYHSSSDLRVIVPYRSPPTRNAPNASPFLSFDPPCSQPLKVSATLGIYTARTRCHETHTC